MKQEILECYIILLKLVQQNIDNTEIYNLIKIENIMNNNLALFLKKYANNFYKEFNTVINVFKYPKTGGAGPGSKFSKLFDIFPKLSSSSMIRGIKRAEKYLHSKEALKDFQYYIKTKRK